MEGPKHPKVHHYLEIDLFTNLTCFDDLEGRISNLKTPKERGEAFEVFAEAYFATQPLVQAKIVWPFDVIPHRIKERFALGEGTDLGVDGVLQTHLDQFNAYQVKFRSGRPSLTWNELSTFMGLTDQIAHRVLFTNCNDLPGILSQRSGFFCIRGSDLDRLEPRHFEAILMWLKGLSVPKEKKKPLPHQLEALQNILGVIGSHDRVTTVMACGTGKTLVALWVAERMGCRKVLVLVPALALLRQTLHEWMREISLERISYLCVCSDPTVEKNIDDLIVRQSDLDFPVSTDSQTVKKFLNTDFDGFKIVFSTYQSAKVVAEGMDKNNPFELGIFDEAHKTAGREGVNFSFALKDKNLPIRKRLFMTATPRHYDVQRKDKEGDSRLVYSMDVPEIYGPISHQLSFAEAARRGIITDYKVIVPIITSEMVTRERLRRGEVVIDGDQIKAKQVANQIALQMTIDKYGVRKIFTFHGTVASARSFTSSGSEGIVTHLPDFEAYHVNGTMPAANRESLMVAFREGNKAVMSNARCLTEGIDVPAVDMVAFLSPKRSKVDIVQATGRAMRKEAGKTTGYVLVPLFIQEAMGESVEEAIQHTRFDEIWNVLQAMQEQDEVLADVIRQMREDRGRGSGYEDSRFKEKVDFLGPELPLETLRKTITARCIDKLADTWDEHYGELKAFKKRFGHCNVSRFWLENPKLGRWVQFQRINKNFMKERRVRLLNEIGFIWDPYDAAWETMFTILVKFKNIYGHCNVKQGWSKNAKLGKWVSHQRSHKKRGRLTEIHIQRLNGIGFEWDFIGNIWERMFSSLLQFRATYGHCNVPDGYTNNPKLARWIQRQRQFYKNNRLSRERFSRLNEIGFDWEPLDKNWETMFSELIKFKKSYGHCNVPSRWTENPILGKWVSGLRNNKKKGILAENRIHKLDEIGFSWEPLRETWENMFLALLDYKNAYTDCNVPDGWPNNPKLAKWVQKQRGFYRNNKLSQQRFKHLDEIGFNWEPLDETWEIMFAELIEFKKFHGHCNVPSRWTKNHKLGHWVAFQRHLKKRGKLAEERFVRLEKLGLTFSILKINRKNRF